MEMNLRVNKWSISMKDIREIAKDEKVARVMLDIAFCDPEGCRDVDAYLELLHFTAEEIIERLGK